MTRLEALLAYQQTELEKERAEAAVRSTPALCPCRPQADGTANRPSKGSSPVIEAAQPLLPRESCSVPNT